MSDYTPSTEQVRAAYIATQRRFVEDPVPKQDVATEFARWLAEHDRQMRAEGWRRASDQSCGCISSTYADDEDEAEVVEQTDCHTVTNDGRGTIRMTQQQDCSHDSDELWARLFPRSHRAATG